MAIGTMQGAAGFYDINRDVYYSERDRYEREMHFRRQQEEEYRRMQNSYFNLAQQPQLANTTSKPDPKDPLAFLTKTDNKILLTGEAT
ncbi:MAG: hypothetical protein ACK52I_08835 [Pseudomonadota bacterium]|jgi:hypothetical protein